MYKDFPYAPYPHTNITTSIINLLHQSGTCIDESTFAYNNHPKSIVYTMFLCWYYTFCGFGQMHSGIYPPLQQRSEYVHSPKTPLCSAYSFLHSSPSHYKYKMSLKIRVLFFEGKN